MGGNQPGGPVSTRPYCLDVESAPRPDQRTSVMAEAWAISKGSFHAGDGIMSALIVVDNRRPSPRPRPRSIQVQRWSGSAANRPLHKIKKFGRFHASRHEGEWMAPSATPCPGYGNSAAQARGKAFRPEDARWKRIEQIRRVLREKRTLKRRRTEANENPARPEPANAQESKARCAPDLHYCASRCWQRNQ